MATLDTDHVVALMRAAGVPVTRESWIDMAFGDQMPGRWSMADELQVPEELQDLSKVENDDDDEPAEGQEDDLAVDEETF